MNENSIYKLACLCRGEWPSEAPAHRPRQAANSRWRPWGRCAGPAAGAELRPRRLPRPAHAERLPTDPATRPLRPARSPGTAAAAPAPGSAQPRPSRVRGAARAAPDRGSALGPATPVEADDRLHGDGRQQTSSSAGPCRAGGAVRKVRTRRPSCRGSPAGDGLLQRWARAPASWPQALPRKPLAGPHRARCWKRPSRPPSSRLSRACGAWRAPFARDASGHVAHCASGSRCPSPSRASRKSGLVRAASSLCPRERRRPVTRPPASGSSVSSSLSLNVRDIYIPCTVVYSRVLAIFILLIISQAFLKITLLSVNSLDSFL